ncbi:hypothetical protein [Aeromicrobium marinum]|uniref:hypothetical protein n=1 Tax=Aeromicrobium marinum TaxID=219314 RepID=UPI0006803ECC|nr:hypothetical protein [Aeromicrobium marinum]
MTDLAVAAGGAAWEPDVLAEIGRAPGLRLVRRCVDVAELIAVARSGAVGVALVDAALPGLDADAVHQLESVGVRVAAVGDHDGAAARRGVTVVVEPGRIDAVDLLTPPAAVPARQHGTLVAVWGPGGSPGRSTVALSVAAATAARGLGTALVDADTYGGSIGQQFAVLDDDRGQRHRSVLVEV